MKQSVLSIIFCLAFFSSNGIFAQELAIGISSGVNFSDIHGNDPSSRWKPKYGPLDKLSVEFTFLKIFSLRTGATFSSVYYQNIYYKSKSPVYDPLYDYQYNYYTPEFDFNSISIPLQAGIRFHSFPCLTLSAGAFWSFVTDYDPGYLQSEVPAKNDYGFIASAGISYPLNKRLEINLSGDYLTGRKQFFDYQNYRHGYSGISFGFSYKIISQKNNPAENDSLKINEKFSLIYFGGVSFSTNNPDHYSQKYHTNTGASLGFLINYRWRPNITLMTGASFERRGYEFRDSSDIFYRYAGDYKKNYFVETSVSADYLSIPVLLNLNIGKSSHFNIYSGFSYSFRLNAVCYGTALNLFKNSSEYEITRTTISDDIGKAFKDNDFGWIAGAGYTIPIRGKFDFGLGVRYYHGFSDVYNSSVNKNTRITDAGGKIIRNRSLSFHLQVILPLYKK